MEVVTLESKAELGKAAAARGSELVRQAIEAKGHANLILATGASQFEILEELTSPASGVDWSKVSFFHLDEYVGMSSDHPASFRRYMRERVVSKVDTNADFFPVNGDSANLEAELEKLSDRISQVEIDVCFAGIGENCHLAFNDPPADFDVEAPYIIVELDDVCRKQQFGEGWFSTMDEVPTKAVSMSIRQIMKSKAIILSVPDARKAEAVKNAVLSEVSPEYPASICQQHPNCTLFLDRESASLL